MDLIAHYHVINETPKARQAREHAEKSAMKEEGRKRLAKLRADRK